jgi:hypothetical protein
MLSSHTAPLRPMGIEESRSGTEPATPTQNPPHTYNKILICAIRLFLLLFPSAHKTLPRKDALFNLGEIDLHHHTFSRRATDSPNSSGHHDVPHRIILDPFPHFRHPIPRPPNLDKLLSLDVRWCRRDEKLRVFEITGSTPREIRLMFLPLRMREV